MVFTHLWNHCFNSCHYFKNLIYREDYNKVTVKEKEKLLTG